MPTHIMERRAMKLLFTSLIQLTSAIALSLIVECGGNNHNSRPINPTASVEDFNSNFTGTWVGPVIITVGGQSEWDSFEQPVTAVSANRIRFEDSSCPSFWTTASATEAMLEQPINCYTSSQTGCVIQLTFSSGTFVREGDGARVTLAGNVTL